MGNFQFFFDEGPNFFINFFVTLVRIEIFFYLIWKIYKKRIFWKKKVACTGTIVLIVAIVFELKKHFTT